MDSCKELPIDLNNIHVIQLICILEFSFQTRKRKNENQFLSLIELFSLILAQLSSLTKRLRSSLGRVSTFFLFNSLKAGRLSSRWKSQILKIHQDLWSRSIFGDCCTNYSCRLHFFAENWCFFFITGHATFRSLLSFATCRRKFSLEH